MDLNNYDVPIFILRNIEELALLEQVLKKEIPQVHIGKYFNYKAIYTPIRIFEETLNIGTSIAQKNNLKGLWLNGINEFVPIGYLPLISYKINGIVIGTHIFDKLSIDTFNSKKKPRDYNKELKIFLNKVKEVLNCNVICGLYNSDLEEKANIYVNSNSKDLNEIKEKYEELERNILPDFLIKEDTLQRKKQ